MRIILYAGKGGVGKTTMASATAVKCAELGQRTLVISTDAASCLSDSFDLPIGAEPTRVMKNLWAQETEVDATVGKQWKIIQDWLAAFLAGYGIEEVYADEMIALPGMEELANLLYIMKYASGKQYDVIVVDCAPTGEALRLLSLPEVLQWWIRKLSAGNGLTKVGQKIIGSLVELPAVKAEVVDSAKQVVDRLCEMKALLSDSKVTSVRLVLKPEKMVIRETQRFFTYLNLYGYLTDMVICNRLIPDSVHDAYFKEQKHSQQQYLRSIEERFPPLPILSVPVLRQEAVGLESLKEIAGILYAKHNPIEFHYHNNAQIITRDNGHYTLSLDLPDARKEEISLAREGDEIMITVGRYRRSIILPRTLVKLEVNRAAFQDGRLAVTFGSNQKKKQV